jgi:hypothetical protein
MVGFGDGWAYNKSAETCAYWTSTIEKERMGAKQPTYVDCDGVFRSGGRVYYTWSVGVRPMMFIDLNKIPCEHEYGEWIITAEPSCTTPGTKQHTCNKCGKEENVDTEELGHDWSDWNTTKEATDTETGIKSRSCNRCGISETQDIPVIGHIHSWGEWERIKQPGYKKKGQDQRKCTTCGETETRDVDALIPETITDYNEVNSLSGASVASDENGSQSSNNEINLEVIRARDKVLSSINSQLREGKKEITVDLGNYHSFNVSFLNELSHNPNVTYIFKYTYNGQEMSDRLPAGTDYNAIKKKLNGNQWLGPLFRRTIDARTIDTDTLNYNYSNELDAVRNWILHPTNDDKTGISWNYYGGAKDNDTVDCNWFSKFKLFSRGLYGSKLQDIYPEYSIGDPQSDADYVAWSQLNSGIGYAQSTIDYLKRYMSENNETTIYNIYVRDSTKNDPHSILIDKVYYDNGVLKIVLSDNHANDKIQRDTGVNVYNITEQHTYTMDEFISHYGFRHGNPDILKVFGTNKTS